MRCQAAHIKRWASLKKKKKFSRWTRNCESLKTYQIKGVKTLPPRPPLIAPDVLIIFSCRMKSKKPSSSSSGIVWPLHAAAAAVCPRRPRTHFVLVLLTPHFPHIRLPPPAPPPFLQLTECSRNICPWRVAHMRNSNLEVGFWKEK